MCDPERWSEGKGERGRSVAREHIESIKLKKILLVIKAISPAKTHKKM
jgi:hypothetical protein